MHQPAIYLLITLLLAVAPSFADINEDISFDDPRIIKSTQYAWSTWTNSNANAVCPNQEGLFADRVEGHSIGLNFTGTAITVSGYADPQNGSITIQIDNEPPTTLRIDPATIEKNCDPVFNRQNLEEKNHYLNLTFNDRQFVFTRFTTTRPSPDKGLSVGEKAGIGIGAASLVVAILGIIGWKKSWFNRSRK
ncbi:hypothetical protein CPB86DRAFT_817122 [Serendipita vermifera]|nr:hypothetical protein CPB86DRAFT_817122 [Serendipita vermifera]